MATSSRRDIELDPRFFVPPGVIDVRQEMRDDTYMQYSGNIDDIAGPDSGPILSDPNAAVPNAPSSYTIVSQTIRVAADGRTVVDVLLEFPDNTGAYDIDVRVTPA